MAWKDLSSQVAEEFGGDVWTSTVDSLVALDLARRLKNRRARGRAKMSPSEARKRDKERKRAARAADPAKAKETSRMQSAAHRARMYAAGYRKTRGVWVKAQLESVPTTDTK